MKSKPKITSRNKPLPQKNKSHIRLDQNRASKYPWLLYLATSFECQPSIFLSNPPLNSYEERKGKQSCISFEQNSCHKLSGHLPWPTEGSRDRCGKTQSMSLCLGHWGTAGGIPYWQRYQWGGSLGSAATRIVFQEAEHRVRKQQYGPDSSHSHVSLFLFC